MPKQARDALQRWRTVLDPPFGKWPVFPTNHAPSKYTAVRAVRENADDLLDDANVDAVLQDQDITPPSITTEGVRRVLEKIVKTSEHDRAVKALAKKYKRQSNVKETYTDYISSYPDMTIRVGAGKPHPRPVHQVYERAREAD